jgi:peptidoglycan/xylan/chitin deacetylase (PgdA/CDA1 family)
MKCASPFLRRIVYPGLSRAGCLRPLIDRGPRVLTYHGVFPEGYRRVYPELDGNLVTHKALRQQLEFVRNHYDVIRPGDFLAWCEGKQSLSDRAVLLTCDDGLRNHLTEMVPILQEFDFSGLFFVTGASLATQPAMLWFDELFLMLMAAPQGTQLELSATSTYEVQSGHSQRRVFWRALVEMMLPWEGHQRGELLGRIRTQLGLRTSDLCDSAAQRDRFLLLNTDDLKELVAAGMMIGAHSMSHPKLSQLRQDLASHEISESRKCLERALEQKIWALAYPFGESSSVGDREVKFAEEAGYACAFLNVDQEWSKRTSRFALPRIHITASMSLPEFEAHLSGFHRSLQRRFTRADHVFVGANT